MTMMFKWIRNSGIALYVTVSAVMGRQEAPTGVMVVPESGSHFLVAWEYLGEAVDGFRIERKRRGADWIIAGEVPSHVRTFSSTGCIPFTSYSHRVVALYGEHAAASEAVVSKTFSMLTHRRATIIESGSARQSESTFVRLKNGDLALYYSDMVTVSDLAEAQISVKISKDSGDTWAPRKVVFSEPGMALFLPSVMRLTNDNIAITYARRIPGEWFSKRVIRISQDEGETWSDEQVITGDAYDYTTGSHDRFYQLSNGDLIILVHSVIDNPDKTAQKHLVTEVYGSFDDGHTWSNWSQMPLDVPQSLTDKGELGFWEASLVELEDGELLVVGRTATGWLYGSRSYDYGRTWSKAEQMGIRNPLAPPYLKKLPDSGTIVYLNNSRIFTDHPTTVFGDRFVLGSQISRDGGRSWQNYKEIEHHSTNWWYQYPNMLIEADTAHISYAAVELTPEGKWGKLNLAYLKLPVSWFLE